MTAPVHAPAESTDAALPPLDDLSRALAGELSVRDLYDVLKMYNDVTARLQESHEKLQAEVMRLRDQLEQKNRELELKNRLAALGEMAAGMAHEIRNPLGGIQLYASTLAQDIADRPQAVELVKKISRQVRHLNELVTGILGFTQHVRCDKSPQNLGDIIQEALDAAQGVLEETRVVVYVEPALRDLTVLVDGPLLVRAFLNLVLNAAQAIAEGRTNADDCVGHIHIGLLPPSPEERRIRVGDNFGVALEIADDGPGIAAPALEKMFHPFFTTRDSGTGLGLAIVHRIVQAHGGEISAGNGPAGGAAFRLFLPGAAAQETTPE